jgi:hypothetical protein
MANDDRRKASPKEGSGLPGYGQPPEDVRTPKLGSPQGFPEDLEDVAQDGGGQKTSVGAPYRNEEAPKQDRPLRGSEKEQHRDKE